MLHRCFEALRGQTLRPSQVVVVVRRDDQQTKDALAAEASGEIELVEVDGGVVTALNAGLDAATGEFIAITDDDAAPWPDWLAKAHGHFRADPELGAVGGRDLVPHDLGPPASTVGLVSFYGRLAGNHHRGYGDPRPADVLKGANMAFRAAALEGVAVDARLLGSGMQIHWEIGLCLAVQRRGWKLVYDPAMLVDHEPGERRNTVQRDSMALSTVFVDAHNQLLGLATGLTSVRRATAVAWALMVGDRKHPGPVLAVERLLAGREGRAVLGRMRAATAGRRRALATAREPAR